GRRWQDAADTAAGAAALMRECGRRHQQEQGTAAERPDHLPPRPSSDPRREHLATPWIAPRPQQRQSSTNECLLPYAAGKYLDRVPVVDHFDGAVGRADEDRVVRMMRRASARRRLVPLHEA